MVGGGRVCSVWSQWLSAGELTVSAIKPTFNLAVGASTSGSNTMGNARLRLESRL